jgi:hypothetical protein
MNITQQPLSLSLSGNLKKFVIGGSAGEAITFKLSKGATTIMEQSLIIPSSESISIDVKEAVEYQLRYILTDTGVAYEQTGIVADFSALINATTVNFRCIRGGVANLADTPTNFLTANFLTWQPIQKKVTYYSPEFLTYYAVVAGNIKLKGYFTNSSGAVVDTKTVTAKALTAGKCYTIPLQYANVVTLLNHTADPYPAYYEVWAENSVATRLSYIQRYIVDVAKSEQEQWLLFENSLGGLDTVRAYGAVALEGDHTHNLSESDDVASEYRVDTERLFEKNTGSLDNYERRWLLDFFPSLHKYIYADATIRAIVVTESDVKYDEGSLPSSYSFTYKYASATALLNITRPAALPTDLVITVPDFGSFTLPPRLAEFPSLALTEGALIALQSPYSEEWGTTTIGSILQYIGDHLADAGGSGGVGHTHNNLTMLQLLSTLDGYLKYNGVKINAGMADDFAASGPAAAKILRKDIPDTAAEKITFKKGIQLGENFVPGVAGTGGAIDGAGNGELKSLKIYESLEVPELRYNRIEINVGDRWNPPGGGIIKSVVPDVLNGVVRMTGTITLKLEAGEIGLIAEQDKCMGIFHYEGDGAESINATEDLDDSKGNRTVKGFFTSYFRVTEILEADNSVFRYALRPDYVTQHHPMSEMHFVAYANADDITRQTSSYETRTYIRHLCRMTEWEISKDNIAAQYGDLSNLSVHGLTMTGYSAYLNNIYMNGTIQQFLDAPVLMEIESSKGDFLAPGETTTITLKIRKGFDELTSTMKQWRWTRDTADPAADLVWKNNHAGYTDSGELSYEDLGNNAFNTTSTVFSFWCSDEVGTVVNGSLTI